MIFARQPTKNLSSEEQRILRAHWEWSGRYALFWIIVTVMIFSGIFLLLDFVGANDSVRTPSLILLTAITVVNAIWRAAGVLAARIELMLISRQGRDNS
jgi:hypothetical protein